MPVAKKTASAKRAPAAKKMATSRAAGQAANTGTLVNKYDAAGTGRRMRAWNPASSGPNRATDGMQRIRDRAHDTVRNDWMGEAAVTRWATNLVGVGFTPRFRRIKSKPRREKVVDLWTDFVKTCDADGVLNFHGMTTLVVRSWFEAGECFARIRPRPTRLGLPVPMQIQLLEAEFCPIFDANTWPGMPSGNTIRQGIEKNQFGDKVAYWMFTEHPGERNFGNLPIAGQIIRIPADQVLHIYEPKRIGALRGVSALANILTRVRSSADLEDAVLDRMKLANLFVAFIKNEFNKGNVDMDPLTGKPYEMSGLSDSPFAALEPGMMQELDPGQSIEFANPPEPGVVMPDYLRTVGLGTAAGANLPYEIMTGDIRQVSDRALRVILLEFRRLCEQKQWQIIIPMWCEKVIAAFSRSAALLGKVSVAEADLINRAEWSPHGWEYIHPVQDPQGKQIEVDAGFRSRSSVIAARGDDPDQVDAERAADDQREKDLGIAPAIIAPDPNAPNSTTPTKKKKPVALMSEDE